jgi:hypothetical protein
LGLRVQNEKLFATFRVSSWTINLFVTSKNEITNFPIHQFTNLKCCIKAREPFETPFH